MIVRGLVEAYVGSSHRTEKALLSYLGTETGTGLRSIIDPLRYADAVANSSNNPLLDPSHIHDRNLNGEHSIKHWGNRANQPPKDVQDIVKALFMRDLVDLQISGCGYGDFLSWCNLPIHPEPLLFDYISNFPTGGELRSDHWVVDEDGLDQAHLSARYDFSLLLFLRQWHLPWSPGSHFSFSIPHRQAVVTLLLCSHRYGISSDMSCLVASFLPRSWWPDDRRCCWCRECQLNQLKHGYNAKITTRQSNWSPEQGTASVSHLKVEKGGKSPCSALVNCPGCQVAMACSKEHLKTLNQDGHKRYCGLPPFRLPFNHEDNNLCQLIFGENRESGAEDNICSQDNENFDDDDDDDDGSWESLDSNEEVNESNNDMIFSFFEEKSYKFQRRETPAFANFF